MAEYEGTTYEESTYDEFDDLDALTSEVSLDELAVDTDMQMSDEEVEAIAEQVQEETRSEVSKALGAAADTVSQRAAEAGITTEKAAEVAGAARDKTGAATKSAAAGFKRGFGSLASRVGRRLKADQAGSVSGDVTEQLRALKGMLDEGLITQADYDEKKSELLGGRVLVRHLGIRPLHRGTRWADSRRAASGSMAR